MSTSLDPSAGPHQRIDVEHPRDRFTLALFDRLWDEYRRRVSYVRMYEQVVRLHGAKFVNDHIAFRTIATQSPGTGIHTLSRIFEALGYQASGTYQFDDKQLGAIHYQHSHPDFPKLFISELKSWEFDAQTRRTIASACTAIGRRSATTNWQPCAALKAKRHSHRCCSVLRCGSRNSPGTRPSGAPWHR